MARTGVVRAIVPRTLIHVTTAVPTPEASTEASTDEKHTRLDMAVQRPLDEGCPIDPQSAVAPFNSAF